MTSIRDKKFPVVPHGCLYIDASWSDVLAAIPFSVEPSRNRSLLDYKIDRLWNHAHATPSPILPCLSVRTAFDLYLSVKKYPRGSEIVFCAINIPDMARIIRHHGLKVVALDVDLETMAPKADHLESLITPRTVAILVAHLYGRWASLEDVIAVAKKHRLDILEDCAEAFCGVKHHGHPGADITFFSFGLIKTSTAFGGAIAVVRDPALLSQMHTLYRSYPIRARSVYLRKLLKYSMVMTVLNSPFLVKHGTLLLNVLGVNHRELIVKCVRGFPTDFFKNIRMRPSITLLCMLYRRLKNFDLDSFHLGNFKGDFVSQRLPPGIQGVGLKAEKRNYWLFPVVVDDPERFMKEMNARGVDAYRGATQLNLIESDVAIPRDLSNPAEEVPRDLDIASRAEEDACGVDKGVSGGRIGAMHSGFNERRALPRGQWTAGYANTETGLLRASRTGSGVRDSDCRGVRESLHDESMEKCSDHLESSLERSSASGKRTRGSLQSCRDDSKGAFLEQSTAERAKSVGIHAKEASGQSSDVPRGLSWIAQSKDNLNSTTPANLYVTCPSSSELHRSWEMPRESQQQLHLGCASDDLTAVSAGHHSFQCASVSHYVTQSATTAAGTHCQQPGTCGSINHQQVHHELHTTQGISNSGPASNSFHHPDRTNELHGVDQQRTSTNLACNNQRVTRSPNHSLSTEDSSDVGHSSDTYADGATNTEKESKATTSNTGSSCGGGGLQGIPNTSLDHKLGKFPERTFGLCPVTREARPPQSDTVSAGRGGFLAMPHHSMRQHQSGQSPRRTSGDAAEIGEGRPPASCNTNSICQGGSHATPSQHVQHQSWKFPGSPFGDSPQVMSGKYPSEARYLIEHVVYLPVHKKVSFKYLEQICAALEDVASTLAKEKRVKVQSKL